MEEERTHVYVKVDDSTRGMTRLPTTKGRSPQSQSLSLLLIIKLHRNIPGFLLTIVTFSSWKAFVYLFSTSSQ